MRTRAAFLAISLAACTAFRSSNDSSEEPFAGDASASRSDASASSSGGGASSSGASSADGGGSSSGSAADPCATGLCEAFDSAASLSALTGWTTVGNGPALSLSNDAASTPRSFLASSTTKDAVIEHPLRIGQSATCDFDMKVDTWAGKAMFFAIRRKDYANPDYWEIGWGKQDGQAALFQYAYANGSEVSGYPRATAPPPNAWLHVRLHARLPGLATIDVGSTTAFLETPLPDAHTTDFVLLIGLTYVTTGTKLWVDNVVCAVE